MREITYRNIAVCLCIVTLGACMYMPGARDDFSLLGEDAFSNLLREASTTRERVIVPPPLTDRNTATNRINLNEAKKLARRIMLGRTTQQVVTLFAQGDGACGQTIDIGSQIQMTCMVTRRWKLRGTGYLFGKEPDWPDQAVQITFQFVISKEDKIIDTDINIANAPTNW